ncbi:MAG: hypothetical protein V1744_01095 [Candidatus Altiarchaeota archaeon]
MACITVNVDQSLKERMERFSWINWSEVGRQEALKRDILEGYIQNGKVSAEDLRFCETIDWHPVDELPIKGEYAKKLKEIERGPHSRGMNVKELKEWVEAR